MPKARRERRSVLRPVRSEAVFVCWSLPSLRLSTGQWRGDLLLRMWLVHGPEATVVGAVAIQLETDDWLVTKFSPIGMEGYNEHRTRESCSSSPAFEPVPFLGDVLRLPLREYLHP